MVKIKRKKQHFSTVNDFPTTPKGVIDRYYNNLLYKERRKPGVDWTEKKRNETR